MNDIVNDRALTHLGAAETRLAAILARPKPVAIACVAALATLGWAACGLLPPGTANAWPDVLCRSTLGRVLSATDSLLVYGMWAAMTLAMMLPTAGPMILTYAEIADTAARKAERVGLADGSHRGLCGDLARLRARSQRVANRFSHSPQWPKFRPFEAPLSGAIFLAAGLYQFSSLKAACLSALPAAVSVLFRELDHANARRLCARAAPRSLLPRLLLGADAGHVRGRHHECALDGGPWRAHDDREDVDHGAVLARASALRSSQSASLFFAMEFK